MPEEYVSLPLVTVGEAARLLGVGRKVVYQLIERGGIKAVKANGAIRIEKRSIDDYAGSGLLT